MNEWIIISLFIVAILILIGVVLTLTFLKKKKDGIVGETNYQVFFTIGMVWFPVGVVFMLTINSTIGIVFIALGATYLAISLANRDKWKEREK